MVFSNVYQSLYFFNIALKKDVLAISFRHACTSGGIASKGKS